MSSMSGEETFVCRQCGRELTLDSFYRNPQLRLGHEPKCKQCMADNHKAWVPRLGVIAKRCIKCDELLGIDYFQKGHDICCTCEMGW